MSFLEFLLMLQGPWINAAVGIVLSFMLEYVPGWEAMPSKNKRLVTFALCFVVPALSAVVGMATGYQEVSFNNVLWPALYAGGLVAFGTSTAAHTRKLQ